MSKIIPSREEALSLLLLYNQSESLINHAKSVEAVMRHFAKLNNEDAEKWGIIGLVHDLDYEKFPQEHCIKTKQILKELNWDDEYIRAVISHGFGIINDVEPLTQLEKTLYAIDELTGLITACVLVRPSKSIIDLGVKSVKKKWKEKSFAAGANREIILKGAEMLGISLEELIKETIEGMKSIAAEICLE